ncbi:MAG: thiamine pyrophosphate-binding protein [Candidatus Dormibacteraeota bacterium]|nr:thiamine pyrophosphate-binding protein [Candidatus Dormibacteraeota bacterium]MBO0762100.1 thiamine pyrophosphate-binding protein [Candidatus Dormibacteraeota bacterium]
MSNRYGSDLIVDVLNRYEVPFAALNPGSTFRGLHDSIVNHGGNCPEIVECPHEEIAVAMAHGYAKATGRPMAAIVHDTVGLLHAAMAIYYAYLDRVPVIVLGATGPMDPTRRRPHIDWIHTAIAQGTAVRDYVKWDYQPEGAADVVESFARAYRVATSEPQGPVYLCYDAGFQEDPLAEYPAIPSRDQVLPTRLAADPAALDQAARWLVEASNPVVVTELAGRRPESLPVLVELAELLGAAVVDRGQRLSFPNRHRLNLTGSPDVLQAADLVLALDVRDLFGALSRVDREARRASLVTAPGCRVVEIGLGDLGIRAWPQDQQRLQPVDLSVLADTGLALPALLAHCRELVTEERAAAFARRASEHERTHEALHAGWWSEARARAGETPVAVPHLAAEIWETIRETDWVLTGNTLRDWTGRLWDLDESGRHPGKGLGTATEIGISLGVALAHRGTGRLVVDIQPDGDLMFDVGALWVASHHRIPLLAVMFNNRSYYNDEEHQVLIAKARGRDPEMAYLGMEIARPAPDFATIARGFGWYSEGPVEKPGEVRAAVARARDVVLEQGRPALVDVVTQPR